MFLDALQARQKESYVFRGIGQLILQAAVEWGPAYTAYTVNFPMADWLFKEEKARNPRFNDLLMVCDVLRYSSHSSTDPVSLAGLPKASGSSKARLRYLPQSSHFPRTALRPPPRSNLQVCTRGRPRPRVCAACDVGDQAAGHRSQRGHRIDQEQGCPARVSSRSCAEERRYFGEWSLVELRSTGSLSLEQDLELLDDSRRFFTASKVYRRPDGAVLTEWSDAYLILFDHYRSSSFRYQLRRALADF